MSVYRKTVRSIQVRTILSGFFTQTLSDTKKVQWMPSIKKFWKQALFGGLDELSRNYMVTKQKGVGWVVISWFLGKEHMLCVSGKSVLKRFFWFHNVKSQETNFSISLLPAEFSPGARACLALFLHHPRSDSPDPGTGAFSSRWTKGLSCALDFACTWWRRTGGGTQGRKGKELQKVGIFAFMSSPCFIS